MGLHPGVRVGAYEVVSLIGAGGMGEVYRARDLTLHRDVAIKVLPEGLAQDADRLVRFEREARTLAALNHPHIAQVYGFERSGGIHALVMELIDGPTLADRIAQGPIPVEEMLPIARQIAEALEAAHEQGIIHRDLKPANIKLRSDGAVKVLDFGLAKLVGPSEAGPYAQRGVGAGFSRPDATASPTLTSPAATGLGVILGTAAYMSPEQARGKPVDKRSDIWAFGCVLYEMLTARRVFEGEEITDTLARVIEREPDLSALPAATPAAIRRLLRRCLDKDRKRRLTDIGVARIEIDEAMQVPRAEEVVSPRPNAAAPGRTAWALAVAAAVAMTAGGAWYLRPSQSELPEMRLQINTPPGNPAHFAISPDGESIVFHAATSQGTQLWLRRLDAEDARVLDDTAGASYPFWSPDGQSIGFFVDQKLKRIDVAGGAARILADTPNAGNGGTWGRNGVILFVPSNKDVYRVSAEGGAAVPVTRVRAPQLAHRFPQFLPDGRHFIYWVSGTPDVNGAYVGELDADTPRRLLDADMLAGFAPPDYLLYVRRETLLAQRLNIDTFALLGDPLPVSDSVAQDSSFITHAAVSASAVGLIGYRRPAVIRRQVVWSDCTGQRLETMGAYDTQSSVSNDQLGVSRDWRVTGFHRRVDGQSDVWLMDIERGVLRRFTSDAAHDSTPFWSPDGRRIAFESNRRGVRDLYLRSADDAAREEVLLESAESKNLNDWSPDGRFILYSSVNSETGRDLWSLPLTGDRIPSPVVQSRFEEDFGRFSPDGRWIAFESNETGRDEVYVRPFPGPGSSTQISRNGGGDPRWRGDGRELFYVSADQRLMAVPIALPQNGFAVAPGNPAPLFAIHQNAAYEASPDGRRFLINTPVGEDAMPPITILLNWRGGRSR